MCNMNVWNSIISHCGFANSQVAYLTPRIFFGSAHHKPAAHIMATQTKYHVPPLRVVIESSQKLPSHVAAAQLEKFLHESTAVHSAPNTVVTQLQKLYEKLSKKSVVITEE